MERYIYYSGQRDWDIEDYDYLNSFLNKIFLYRKEREEYRYRISHMNLYAMEHKTKAILKALLQTQGIYNQMLKENKNLIGLKDVKPLDEPLYLSEEPTHAFEFYEKMNIIL